jgi:hypothetical protein
MIILKKSKDKRSADDDTPLSEAGKEASKRIEKINRDLQRGNGHYLRRRDQ